MAVTTFFPSQSLPCKYETAPTVVTRGTNRNNTQCPRVRASPSVAPSLPFPSRSAASLPRFGQAGRAKLPSGPRGYLMPDAAQSVLMASIGLSSCPGHGRRRRGGGGPPRLPGPQAARQCCHPTAWRRKGRGAALTCPPGGEGSSRKVCAGFARPATCDCGNRAGTGNRCRREGLLECKVGARGAAGYRYSRCAGRTARGERTLTLRGSSYHPLPPTPTPIYRNPSCHGSRAGC